METEDQAQAWSKNVHPYTRARPLYYDGIVRQFVGDWDAVRRHGEAASAMAQEHDYVLVQAAGSVLQG